MYSIIIFPRLLLDILLEGDIIFLHPRLVRDYLTRDIHEALAVEGVDTLYIFGGIMSI